MTQSIHILGICGTFMGSLAIIARQMGYTVTGSDQNAYPPMSTYLARSGITVYDGYDPANIPAGVDQVLIGNTLKRGRDIVEYVLNSGLRYCSGAQWLYEHVLVNRHVLAVSGTHGKTTTTSMLVWLLECCGYNPGFLIGGVSRDFGVSSRVTDSPYFVIEADEYDTAFFDKRSKFIHYHPLTLIINNIEFDHADLFPSLAAIQQQFDHLLRTLPGKATVIYAADSPAVQPVIEQGCWSHALRFGAAHSGRETLPWQYRLLSADGSRFEVLEHGAGTGKVEWALIGEHNVSNALAAIAAAADIGIDPARAMEALEHFKGVKRRLECVARAPLWKIYDDFAHHPTAIDHSVQALRHRVGAEQLVAVLEPRSNTMKMGTLKAQLVPALQAADAVFVYEPPGLRWSMQETFACLDRPVAVFDDYDALAEAVITHTLHNAEQGLVSHLLVMSNGSFNDIHTTMADELSRKGST